MELTLTPNVGLQYGNAHYLAIAALGVYDQNTNQIRADLKLEGQLVGVDHFQAFVGASETDIVVAFRGTQSPRTVDGRKDWLLTNARQQLALPPEGEFGQDFAAIDPDARFHQGFLEALEVLWEQLFPPLQRLWRERERPVWVTGHSLGGALATLAAWRIERREIGVHRVYTFAAPMVCDGAGVSGYNLRLLTRTFRFVNEADLIPALPISNLLNNDYHHVGMSESLPADSAVPWSSARELITSLLRFAGALTLAPTAATIGALIWREFGNRLDAHDLSKGYISRIIDRRKAQGER